MATKVNTKFVIILAGALFLLFVGVAGLTGLAHLRSAGRLIQAGDAAYAAGDYDEARRKYSRAVNKDQTNVEWIEKWRDALLKTTPETQIEYNKAYNEQYLGMILRQLATVQSSRPGPQIEFVAALDERLRRFPGGGSVSAFQSLAATVDERAQRLDPDDPQTKALLGYRGRAIVDQMRRDDTVGADAAESVFEVGTERPITMAELAMSDLRGALEADPTDTRNALAILQWYESEFRRLEGRSRDALADQVRQEARRELAAFVEQSPDDPDLMLFRFGAAYRDAARDAGTRDAQRALVESMRPGAVALLDRIAEIPAEELEATTVRGTIGQLIAFLMEGEDRDRLLAFLEGAIESRPADPELRIILGRLQLSRGDYADAYDAFQGVLDLPTQPVSLEGMLLPAFKQVANAEQVDALLAQHELSADEDEKAEIFRRILERREALAERSDVNAQAALKLRDAKIAIIEGRIEVASGILSELKAESPDNVVVLNLLAKTLTDSGLLGEARNVYEEVIDLGAATDNTYVRLADIELSLQNPAGAVDRLERALEINPGNEYAQRRLIGIRTAQGDVGAGETIDPIVAALLEFREARLEGDTDRARSIIAEARAAHPGDLRLIREQVALSVASGDRDGALAIVDEALEARPDSRDLSQLREFLGHEDPLEAAIAVAQSSDAPEIQKRLAVYNIYSQNRMADEADAAFAAAEDLDPNHPTVIEVGFMRSLTRAGTPGLAAEERDAAIARAERYAERAAEQNVDQRGGLTFKGRLELAKGETREAETTLQRAVERLEYDPDGWRWLAKAQRANGKLDVAIESYRRAYDADPRSAPVAAEYALALLTAGQGETALEVINPEDGALRFNPRSDALRDLWLRLEAQFGDRDAAIDARRNRFERDPSDMANARSFVLALIEAGRWDEASRALERLAAVEGADPFMVAQLETRRLASMGDIDGARAALAEYVASVPEDDERVLPSRIALGAFEREFGTDELALAAYERALPYQDPERREVDRSLGDLLFTLGEAATRDARTLDGPERDAKMGQAREFYFRANEHYRAIADVAPTVEDLVTKRRAETLVRLSQYAEAMELLESLDDDEDLQVLLLRSIIAAGDGDAREARRMLNRAVELYPSDPTTFFRRAALNSSDPALFTDAIQDLDKAVELRPDYVEAWTLRFSLYRREGQMDEAFTQLRRAVDANPQNDEMKQFLLTELRRNGREGEAQAFAVQVADDKGEDREWLRLAAVLSYDNGAYNEAERLFRKIYDLEPDPLSASDLLNVILRKDVKPTRAEVNRTLAIVKESDRRTVGMLMLQARAHEFLEEPGPAETLTLEAYQEASASSILARHWFDNLLLRFDGDLDRTFAYLRGTDELGTLPPVLRVMMIRRDTQDGVSVEDCLANLEALKPEAQGDAFTMIELLRLENQLNYTLGNYEACVAACRMGLQIAPRDLELNNNLAYTLAKHLNDPEAAKPFAERAAQIAPLNPAVLDTLGWVYYETGQYRDADRVLDRALQTSKTPDNRVPAYLHLAMCKRAIGDEPEARRLIGLARTEVTGASQAIQDQYTEEIEALYAELN